MALFSVVATAVALWLSAKVVGGIRLDAGPDPLATIGTVLVVALLLGIVNHVTRRLRRLVAALVEPLPIAVAALVGLNAALFWLTAAVAAALGLGYAVDGFTAALLGSLLTLLVSWLARLALDQPR